MEGILLTHSSIHHQPWFESGAVVRLHPDCRTYSQYETQRISTGRSGRRPREGLVTIHQTAKSRETQSNCLRYSAAWSIPTISCRLRNSLRTDASQYSTKRTRIWQNRVVGHGYESSCPHFLQYANHVPSYRMHKLEALLGAAQSAYASSN